MSDRKKIRKNRYKNPKSKRRYGISLRISSKFGFFLKAFGGIGIISFLSISLIFIHDLLTQCDYFRAEDIKISGGKRLSDQEVLKYAGIQRGDNILSINLSLARTRLMDHPWIEDVEIRRELPSGISVRVREHSALAVLDMGRKFLINHKGEIFKENEVSDPKNLPYVCGLDYSDLNASDKKRSVPLSAVLEWLLIESKESFILPEMKIEKITVDREIGITLQISGGVRSICLGYNDYSSKKNRLRRIVRYLRNRSQLKEIQSINLINPDRVILRPVG
ncbi:MAG: FtsQ-type POTRA domain-containing protein [Deltaproteobacteria bacterium]|nr:FtsQ-type POTRA domain-containing protein [Deltaproteobacteria bacterium]